MRTALTGHLLCFAVKPEAPVNLTIHNMSGNQLQLTWSSPYPKEQCLEHVVKYKSNKDTSWTVTVPPPHLPPSHAVLALTAHPSSLCRIRR